MLRVLVCGSRFYTDKYKVWKVLDLVQAEENEPIIVIEGRCTKGGADMFAGQWATKNLPIENHLQFPADWHKYKKSAGPIRNRQMLIEGKPDLVLAFGGRDGTGTNHMVAISKAAGLDPVEFDR